MAQGQGAEWSENRSLDWWLLDDQDHRGVQHCVRDMNNAYTATPAMWAWDHNPDGFEWIDANDATDNVFSWLRRGPDGSAMACVSNMSPVVRHGYKLGLPSSGQWDEVLNTDSDTYGGSGVGNYGKILAEDSQWHGRPASAEITLPPLATVWFRKVD